MGLSPSEQCAREVWSKWTLNRCRSSTAHHPTVRAENFWARPAHSRQRRTSSGQTRILSQRGKESIQITHDPKSTLTLVWGSLYPKWIFRMRLSGSTIVLVHKKYAGRWSRGCRFISIRLSSFVCQTVCEDTLFISGCVINPLVSLTFSPPSVSLLTFSLSSIRLLFSTTRPSTHHFLV